MERVQRELGDKDRGAYFVAVLALAWPGWRDRRCSAARSHGQLIWPPRGDRGFGYDPIFVPDGGTTDLRRDRPGREAPDQPPRPRLRQARRACLWALRYRRRPLRMRGDHLPPRSGRGLGWGPTSREPLAVYIHWPFCRSKCPYCDFNSHVRDSVDEARWTRALLADLDHQADADAGPRSRLGLFRRRHAVADAARDGRGAARRGCKRTVAGRARSRNHPGGQPEFGRGRALSRVCRGRGQPAVARRPGARPGGAAVSRPRATTATRRSRRSSMAARQLSAVLVRPDLRPPGPERCRMAGASSTRRSTLAGEHLSLYQLTIEPGTAFATLAPRAANLPCPTRRPRPALFETTQDRLAAAGLPAYEISNHARPGAECRHNLAYWRYQDYLGIGPGAHGRLTRGGGKFATRQYRLPESLARGDRGDRRPASKRRRRSTATPPSRKC